MNANSYLFLPLLTIAALTLSGCGKGSETATEKQIEKSLRDSGASEAKVDLDKGKMTIKTDSGEVHVSTGDAVALPADFPKDVYIAKDAKIQTAMKSPDGTIVQMSVPQVKEKLAESYSSKMKAQGWAQEAALDMNDTCNRIFKKDKRQVAVALTQGDSATDVLMTLTVED